MLEFNARIQIRNLGKIINHKQKIQIQTKKQILYILYYPSSFQEYLGYYALLIHMKYPN